MKFYTEKLKTFNESNKILTRNKNFRCYGKILL